MLHRMLLPLLLFGCASIQDAHVATPVDEQGNLAKDARTRSGLVISGEELSDYASSNFGLVEITIENRSSEWLRLSRIALYFGGPEQNAAVYLPTGSEISAWYSATLQRNDIRASNSASVLEALFLLGETAAVIGAVSGKPAVSAAGGATALGALTISAVDAQAERVSSVEHVEALPSTHLLALPFSVPPGLFTKRWVLLNTRDTGTPCLRQVLLDYDVQSGGLALGAGQRSSRERVLLKFRYAGDRSSWQARVCLPAPPPGGWGYHP